MNPNQAANKPNNIPNEANKAVKKPLTSVNAKNNNQHIHENVNNTIINNANKNTTLNPPKGSMVITQQQKALEVKHNPNEAHLNDPKTADQAKHNEPKIPKEHQKQSQNQNIAGKQKKEADNHSPLLENLDLNNTIMPNEEGINNQNIIEQTKKKENSKISASTLSVSMLAKIQYKAFPDVKQSKEALGNIVGFGVNSYHGKVKNYNEDKIRAVALHKCQSKINPNITHVVSYFGIFDGHGGNNCSEFLKLNYFEYLTNSPHFPDNPIIAIHEAFKKSEENFFKKAFDPKSKKLLDKSGSCALIMLIIDNLLFSINLGDSRALYSYDSGKFLLQITRDHKPNDPVEKSRIEKAGGSVYYANKIIKDGKEIELKEENYGKGFTFPYRVKPSGLAVSNFLNI